MNDRLKKFLLAILAAVTFVSAGCAGMPVDGDEVTTEERNISVSESSETAAPQEEGTIYVSITAQKAKSMMDSESGYIILDVRTPEEYAESHIPGAMLIPYDEVADRAAVELPDKDQLILVYCRSGRRSKLASQTLAELGYTNIKEFGGIIDWPYETTAE
jgi:phage shock protein E